MNEVGECVITAIASRVKMEIDVVLSLKHSPSRAMGHIEEAQKALDALRYRMFQEVHVSGSKE